MVPNTSSLAILALAILSKASFGISHDSFRTLLNSAFTTPLGHGEKSGYVYPPVRFHKLKLEVAKDSRHQFADFEEC